MKELDNEQKKTFTKETSNEERRSKFPGDMLFFPTSNKMAEGVKLKTPWLQKYWSFRDDFYVTEDIKALRNNKKLHLELINKSKDLVSKQDLLTYLKNNNADASDQIDRYRGALLGLMIGDALGVPLEFSPRDSLTVTDIVGGGPFNLEAGDWTDDTSMAFCLSYSLIKCKGFNARHQMECYSYWYKYGAYTPTGTCFDIGNATRQALESFLENGEPFAGSSDPQSAGNGSLMRLAPIVLFYSNDFESAIYYAAESSRTTHQATEAIDACRYFAALIYGALHGEKKETLLNGIYSPISGYWQKHPLAPTVETIANGSYKNKSRNEISSSGYVIHTLEAALWAFYNTDDFRSGALAAVNLADDSDTVGAVYGQLSGAFYGETRIPIYWVLHTNNSQAAYHFAQDLKATQQELIIENRK